MIAIQIFRVVGFYFVTVTGAYLLAQLTSGDKK